MNNEKLVQARMSFPVSRKPKLPEFTLEDMTDLGVKVMETDEMRLIEIPFDTQKALVEVVKQFGFGTKDALDALLSKILQTAGFKGKLSMKVDEATLTWSAWQSRTPFNVPVEQPAGEAAQ